MATAEVTVRGAGIFGLSCAWVLARRGARVQVVDPVGPGAGASGGILGALAPHVPENWNAKKQFQFDSLLEAAAFWAEVDAVSGRASGYARTGRLQPIADAAGRALAEARAQSARTLWAGKALWQVVDGCAQQWAVDCPAGVVHDTLSARLHPRQAIDSLAAALRTIGVPIRPDADDAGLVLHATGTAGLAALSAGRARPVGTAVKGQAALLGHAAPDAPQLFVHGLHVVPHADGTTAIGSIDQRGATDIVSDAALETLIETACRLVPALRDAAVVERWAGLRPRARSRAPILGPWPGRPGHLVANGGFKIGFGMAPGVARTLATLILDGRDEVPDGFRVEDNL